MSPAALIQGLDAVRSYVVDSAERKGWDDRGMAELNEVIRGYVQGIGVTHRGTERNRRLPFDKSCHAMAYVDEHLNAAGSR